MLLKVLLDFRSLQKRDKAHTPTNIHKQERKLTMIMITIIIIVIIIKAQNNKITIQQQGKAFGQVQLLRIKRQLQNYFRKIT